MQPLAFLFFVLFKKNFSFSAALFLFCTFFQEYDQSCESCYCNNDNSDSCCDRSFARLVFRIDISFWSVFIIQIYQRLWCLFIRCGGRIVCRILRIVCIRCTTGSTACCSTTRCSATCCSTTYCSTCTSTGGCTCCTGSSGCTCCTGRSCGSRNCYCDGSCCLNDTVCSSGV